MQKLQVAEIEGKRVLTTSQLAKSYGTTRQVISNNYTRNRERYIADKHFILLEGQPLKDFKASHQIDDNLKFAHTIYLWTEKGALLHAKSLNTDKAWEVYDYLVDFYFRVKKETVFKEAAKREPLKAELASLKYNYNQDAITVFRTLLRVADARGLIIKSKDLAYNKSRLHDDKVAIHKGLTLEEVNFEIAFELYHAAVNYDHGNMINTPLSKYYSAQAIRAAALMIELLNA